ncbi:hypothetical protein BJ508DRAFT_330870 [Ascobolus immersus RN42]|uniref:PNPLA domain-containing protein n=1 Tax=Ascobolus immersus RN42 TaxID=1160509 RepID=A0A3N4HSC7_ASCIM|nr:hypothetical protein BJ508DRAFT_330870 [Ascobolus immersus RN42]
MSPPTQITHQLEDAIRDITKGKAETTNPYLSKRQTVVTVPPLVRKRPVNSSPLDTNGLCLLSLDGGGVRGLSTLYILKLLMDELNEERRNEGLSRVKPCNVFDLIGGTSTGGIIAIMLGRLEMDVEECIEAYTTLMNGIFKKRSLRAVFALLRGKVKGRFSSTHLEEAIQKILLLRNITVRELFHVPNARKENRCKVFVCATSTEMASIQRLRSYRPRGELPSGEPTICEAALATSAATSFFDPVKIGHRVFVDGALGANNPVEEVENEAMNIWCSNSERETGNNADLQQIVKCFVSIGTGVPSPNAIKDSVMKLLSETLRKIATETERTEAKFMGRWQAKTTVDNRYFRFNVAHGLQSVGIAEYKEKGTIEAATCDYLKHPSRRSKMSHCVNNLLQRESREEAFGAKELQAIVSTGPWPERQPWIELTLPTRPVADPPPPHKAAVQHLRELEDCLFSEKYQARVAVYGLGGAGKTQIALEFVFRMQERHPDLSVFWIPLNSPEAIQQAYEEVASKLGIALDTEDKKNRVKSLVQARLNEDNMGRWLLVFDNADAVDVWKESCMGETKTSDFLDYLPASTKGDILFTTRSIKMVMEQMTGDCIKQVEVKAMMIDEATAMLEVWIGHKGLFVEEDAKLLVQRLTCLPLAIAQAGGFIEQNSVPILEYLELMDKEEESLLSRNFRLEGRYSDSKNPIATTWIISFTKLQKDRPHAAEILKCCSLLDPRNMPNRVFPQAESQVAQIDALGTLTAYSFLTERRESRTYDMHRLVHIATENWLRHTLESSEMTSWKLCMFIVFAAGFPDLDTYKGFREKERSSYLPQVKYVLRTDDANLNQDLGHDSNSDRAKLPLRIRLGDYLQHESRPEEREGVLRHVHALQTELLGSDDPETLTSMNNIGACLSDQHKFKEAETLLRQVLAKREEILGLKHCDTLSTLHCIAFSIGGQLDRKEEAVLEYRRVLELRVEVLGAEHAETLGTLNNVAFALYHCKRFEESEKVFREALEGRTKVLGPNHTDTLLSLHNHVSALQRLKGRSKEAEAGYRKLIEHLKEVNGPEHTITLSAMYGLASTLKTQKRFKESEAGYREIWEIRSRLLGPEHRDTVYAKFTVADLLWDQKDLHGAISMLEEAYDVFRRRLGDQDAFTREALEYLERWRAEAGNIARVQGS